MNLNRLEAMFQIQEIQSKEWYDPERFTTDKRYRMDVMKDHVIGIVEQSISLMNTFDWKKQTLMREENFENSREQCIDIIKYAIGVLHFMGYDYYDCYLAFSAKSNVLAQRWKQQQVEMNELTNVVIVDIDGCLGNYEKRYTEFLEDQIKLIPAEVKRTSYSFNKKYGISKQQEEKYYDQFIKSGYLGELDFIDGSLDVLNCLKESGIKIVLLTARPSWIYNRIFNDTYMWLQNERVPYDMVLWDKDKADAIINNIFPARVLCMIEDRDKHALEVSHLGIQVYLLDKDYNQDVNDTDTIHRVKDWKEIAGALSGYIEELNREGYLRK